MLEMKLNSGKFVIDDMNQTHVDETIAKEIEEEFNNNKDNQDKKRPDLIKD